MLNIIHNFLTQVFLAIDFLICCKRVRKKSFIKTCITIMSHNLAVGTLHNTTQPVYTTQTCILFEYNVFIIRFTFKSYTRIIRYRLRGTLGKCNK